MSNSPSGSISRRRWLRWGLLGTPTAGVLDALALEPSWIRERTFSVGGGKLGFQVAHFTDVHHKGDVDRLESVVRRINASGSRYALFTGDLIEEKSHLDEALRILGGLKMPLIGVPGNHDHWSRAGLDRFRKGFEAGGGRFLRDGSVRLEPGLEVVGLDHLHPRPPDRSGDAFQLLLVHYPAWANSVVPTPSDRRYDLILAGHTHGGQVRLPGIGALVTPFDTDGYEMGWYETPSGPLYVNPGIGSLMADVRFLCRPEITYFRI